MSAATVIVVRCLGCMVALAATGLAAQTVQPPDGYLPGEVPPSISQMQFSKANLLTMGLQVSTDFDDNALNGSRDQRGNLFTVIQPRLGWRLTHTRFDWEADYAPSFSRNENLSAYDSIAHRLDTGVQLKLTKRLRLRAHESFLKSTNPFDQLRATEAAAGSGIRNVPDTAVPATPADVRTEQASIDIAYVVGAHGTAGVGGEFSSTRYGLLPATQVPNQLLENSTSTQGHGYYTRQVTRHQWIGFDYGLQKSIFRSGESWSLVHSVIYTHTIAVSRPLTLSFFSGPERSVTEVTGAFSPLAPVTSGHPPIWRWSGGVTGRWNGIHTSFIAKYARKTSNDAVLGAAQLSKISAELRQQFARQWTVRLLASYDDNKALAVPGSLTYSSAAAGLTRPLGPNLSLEFQYWRVHLSGQGSLPASLLSDYNRISMSLIYSYKYPRGR